MINNTYLEMAKEDLAAIEKHVKACQKHGFEVMPDVVLFRIESAMKALNIDVNASGAAYDDAIGLASISSCFALLAPSLAFHRSRAGHILSHL